MIRMRQILLTGLLVSGAFLAGCEGRRRLSYSGGYYWSDGLYPHSTYQRPTHLHTPSSTVYVGSGSLYYPGTITHTRIYSYPRVYRPMTIHRGYPYSGHYRPPVSHPRPQGHSRGPGSRGRR